MMIRINLLPVRQVQKREFGRQLLVLYGVVFLGTTIANYLWYDNRASQAERYQQRATETQNRIAELEKVIGEVNNINKRKKEVEDKLKILGDLRKGRSGPVRMLDALATAIPKKVWLLDFVESSNAVKLKGTAVSHEDVAEFMRSLANVVWTPKGMGRLVEQKRDAKTSRVELLSGDGVIEDFQVGEITALFTGIDLSKAETKETKDGSLVGRRVEFEIAMTTNYSI
ncbi:MAG: PilN domain-containing protein [Myxococcota bacterium]